MTVYFVQSQEYVKIGYSISPVSRVSGIQTSNPHPVEILFFIPGGPEVEREFHKIFRTYRHKNEWYRLEGNLLAFTNLASSIFSEYTINLQKIGYRRLEEGTEEFFSEWVGDENHKLALFTEWMRRVDDPTPEKFTSEFGTSRRTFYYWKARVEQ